MTDAVSSTGRLEADLLLLDLDGTLVNSNESVHRMWRAWCEKENIDAEKLLARSEGRQGCDVVAEFAPHLDPVAEDAWIIDYQLRDVTGVVPIAGVHEAIASLGDEGWAIVTSCVRDLAHARLRAVDLPDPPLLVPADDPGVARSKPHPDGFLRAAGLKQIDPAACVVFEDSQAGVRAAKAAGMRSVAITAASSEAPPADYATTDWRGVAMRRGSSRRWEVEVRRPSG